MQNTFSHALNGLRKERVPTTDIQFENIRVFIVLSFLLINRVKISNKKLNYIENFIKIVSKRVKTSKFNYSMLNLYKYEQKSTNFNYFIIYYIKLSKDFKISFINMC